MVGGEKVKMTDIIVDMFSLQESSKELSKAIAKLNTVDENFQRLRSQSNISELTQIYNLLRYRDKLIQCNQYLLAVMNEFNAVESEISKIDPAKFDETPSSASIESILAGLHTFGGSVSGDISYVMPKVNGMMFNHLADYGKEKIDEYLALYNGDLSVRETKDNVVKWLSNLRKDANQFKDYLEYITGDDIKWPSPIKDGFSFIKSIDFVNKLGNGAYDYFDGIISGDVDMQVDGAKSLLSATKSLISKGLKTGNKTTDFKNGIILDYGKNMVCNWLESIAAGDSTSEVYWNTYVNSFLDVVYDKVCNAPTLAIAYQPAKQISALFGYDLQAAYEGVSDKKGFAAVLDSFDQVHDFFEENSTWENWKSGMGEIFDGVKGWFK